MCLSFFSMAYVLLSESKSDTNNLFGSIPTASFLFESKIKLAIGRLGNIPCERNFAWSDQIIKQDLSETNPIGAIYATVLPKKYSELELLRATKFPLLEKEPSQPIRVLLMWGG